MMIVEFHLLHVQSSVMIYVNLQQLYMSIEFEDLQHISVRNVTKTHHLNGEE